MAYLKNTESHIALPHCIGVIEIHFENNNSYTRGNANVFKQKYITAAQVYIFRILCSHSSGRKIICLYLACIGITIFSYISILTKCFEKKLHFHIKPKMLGDI